MVLIVPYKGALRVCSFGLLYLQGVFHIGIAQCGDLVENISKTRLYNFDPLKPHFYIVKLGFTGVYTIFLIFAQKHRLWILVRTASPRRF